jgi:hypothetical protein
MIRQKAKSQESKQVRDDNVRKPTVVFFKSFRIWSPQLNVYSKKSLTLAAGRDKDWRKHDSSSLCAALSIATSVLGNPFDCAATEILQFHLKYKAGHLLYSGNGGRKCAL